MSHSGDDVKGIISLIGVGGFFFWKGFRDLKLEKKISGLATSRIRSMAMGVVELSGIAKRAVASQIDPVYSQPCCYYQLKVEQYQQSGKSGRWVTIYESNSDGIPFLCCDSTGEVPVLPKRPALYFNNRLVCQNGFFGAKNTAALNFLNSRWQGWSSLRLTFDVLRDGDPLFVAGCALSRPLTISAGNKANTPVSLAEAARELKQNAKAMKDLDSNHDGQIDAQEWESGVKIYQAFLEEKRTQSLQAKDPIAPIQFQGVVTQSDENELVLANSEKDLLSRLSRLAYFEIFGGGLALTLGLIWLCYKLT